MTVLDSKTYQNDLNCALAAYNFSELEGKTILVTGAGGLICSALVDLLSCLKGSGVPLRILAAGRDTERLKQRFGSDVRVLAYDALLPVQLPSGIDFIVHGAGIASPDLYLSHPVDTLLSNLTGVKELLNYCADNHTRMVYLSSSEVYGQKSSVLPFKESDYGHIDQDLLRNCYPEAKRAAEMLCKAYHAQYGVHITILRPGHIYGPTASPRDKRISSDFAFKAARGEPLVLLSTGLQQRSYCYCVDAACAILLALLQGKAGEAYNLGSSVATSIREMAAILADSAGVQLQANTPTEQEKNAFNPMSHSTLNDEKLRALGYRELFPPSIGLSHTVAILQGK